MMDKIPYVVAVSSYAVHGVASLKIFTKVLGSYILPVPSLMLGGLTNIEGIKKFEMPLAALLENTLELAVQRNQSIIFYTGYLGSGEQAEIVANAITKYRDIIKFVITDPVCGDNGRSYVPLQIIAKWPEIIKLSDIVSPNFTELKLITGNTADDPREANVFIKQFKDLYPDTCLLLSSQNTNSHNIGIQFHSKVSLFEYGLPLLPKSFGGTGDLLLSLFIRERYYNNLPDDDALKTATDITHQIIQYSINKGSDELLLSDSILSNLTT